MFSRFFALALATFLTVLSSAEPASAYPWMIRHDYTACAQCHVDPSGGGPLNPYGRGMGEILLRTHYGAETDESAAEPGPGAKFLWGAIPLPEFLDFGGSFREMALSQKVDGANLSHQFILMQADLNATVNAGHWVASGSLGYEPNGALLAAVTRGPDTNLVSRYHWLGYHLDEGDTMLLRAGRMNLPFGIRDVLHTLFVRTQTRTNIDDEQQDGVAFSYSGQNIRAELMAILGNYQIRPDAYRERGYTGYFEWSPTTALAVGVSSRLAHVNLDSTLLVPAFRHADGAFGRWATPWRDLVVLAEADYVVDSFKDRPRSQGLATMLQGDFELIQGIHYQLTGEATDVGPHGSAFTLSGWASLLWFFASHADIRLDAIYQSFAGAGERTGTELLLAQVHLYL